MATNLYPISTAGSATVPFRFSSEGTQKLLSLTRGTPVATETDNTIASLRTTAPPTNGTWPGFGTGTLGWGALNTFDEGTVRDSLYWVSNGLAAVTISAAPTANIRALESNAMANYAVSIYVFKISGDGSTTTMIATGANTTELGTTEAARSITTSLAPGSVALADNDRIGILIGWMAGGGTSASTYTASGFYNGASGATGDTFVTFNENITEYVAPAAAVPHSSPYPQILVQ